MKRASWHAWFWLASLLLWLAVMWVASSMPSRPMTPQPILHFDKLAHFIYFSAGGFILLSWLLARDSKPPVWKKLIPFCIIVLAVIGWLDEWHQTFTPHRSGNDPFDWLADVLGASAGVFVRKAIRRWR